MIGALLALQFLTCLPIPIRPKLDPGALGRSMRWFPAIGALVGLLVAAVDLALQPLTPPELRATILVALMVLVTGALHLDGLMDSCDALLATTTPERRLEILWDSRVGSFAVVGATTALLLKYAAVLSLPDPVRVPGFVGALVIARWSMVYAAVRYPVARSEGLAATYKAGARGRDLLFATLLGGSILALALGVAGIGLLIAGWMGTVFLARTILNRIPGLTGDTYGAIAESVEIACLIGIPLFVRIAGEAALLFR
jgi:adenosylcobinamide-GDP ribazoletransferase